MSVPAQLTGWTFDYEYFSSAVQLSMKQDDKMRFIKGQSHCENNLTALARTTFQTFALRINRRADPRTPFLVGCYPIVAAEFVVSLQSAFRKTEASWHRATSTSGKNRDNCRIRKRQTANKIFTRSLQLFLFIFCSVSQWCEIISAEAYSS